MPVVSTSQTTSTTQYALGLYEDLLVTSTATLAVTSDKPVVTQIGYASTIVGGLMWSAFNSTVAWTGLYNRLTVTPTGVIGARACTVIPALASSA